jgi:hypothetical protein
MDLSPKRSSVEYAVSRRSTMFVISWRNPGAEENEFNLIVSTRQHQRQRQPASGGGWITGAEFISQTG